MTNNSCAWAMSSDVCGAHAETLCLPEAAAMATMPAGLRLGEAVVCEGARYADTNLQAMRPQPGHSLLIYGASGARAFVEFLKNRMEAGEFRAVIDRAFPFEVIVDAYRYVKTEQKTGIVVIDVNSEGER